MSIHTNRVYELKTLRDVYAKVPKDRVAACMAELAASIGMLQTGRDSILSIAHGSDFAAMSGEALDFPDVVFWTDDGQPVLDKGHEGADAITRMETDAQTILALRAELAAAKVYEGELTNALHESRVSLGEILKANIDVFDQLVLPVFSVIPHPDAQKAAGEVRTLVKVLTAQHGEFMQKLGTKPSS